MTPPPMMATSDLATMEVMCSQAQNRLPVAHCLHDAHRSLQRSLTVRRRDLVRELECERAAGPFRFNMVDAAGHGRIDPELHACRLETDAGERKRRRDVRLFRKKRRRMR